MYGVFAWKYTLASVTVLFIFHIASIDFMGIKLSASELQYELSWF